MATRTGLRCAAGLLLSQLAIAAPGGAQIYKWVDDKGTVHFGNDPPPRAAVQVMPEDERRPKPAPEPPSPAAAADSDMAVPRAPLRAARGEAEPAQDDVGEIVVDDSDTIVVDDGRGAAVTRYRATSPRNRPGQPIRQPNRQPVRQPRRGR